MFVISMLWSARGVTTKETLAEREVFVGRSRKCHLLLKDETVSGVHCRLIAIEGGVVVMDEGSTNGTWLNDALVVQPTVMTVDDELRVGPYLLRVQSLVGGTNATLARVAPRPSTNEPPTDLQLTQAQVFWRLLGFQEPGTWEQARAAYQARVEDCHPDTVSQLNPELRELADQRLREVEFAWEYIQRLFQRARDAA